jgi:hypothetical protein
MMNNSMRALILMLTSSFAVSVTYAATWNSPSTPQSSASQVNAQDNTAAVSDSQAQVTSTAQTVSATDNQVTLRSVQTPALRYGPKPSFDALDINHDGVISESEADAYPPLANDYLYVARKGSRGVTHAEYDRW